MPVLRLAEHDARECVRTHPLPRDLPLRELPAAIRAVQGRLRSGTPPASTGSVSESHNGHRTPLMARIAAVGDLHCTVDSKGRLRELFTRASQEADVIALCGDLTDYGLPDEAHVLAGEVLGARVPVVGVLGQIAPCLGSSRLEDPIDRMEVSAVFHGHAHHGTTEGRTRRGVPTYNVSMPLLLARGPRAKPFRVVELPVDAEPYGSEHELAPVRARTGS